LQRQRRTRQRQAERFSLVALSPTVLLLVVLTGFPIVYSLWLSLTDLVVSRPRSGRYVGLANYAELFRNGVFLASLWKTGYYSAVFLAGTLVLGMLVALLLNQRFHGRNFVIGCLLIPWAIPKVVNGLIWKWIYDGNYGILNAALVALGVTREYKFWFGESPLLGMLLIAAADIWKLVPFVALVLLAGLQTIPQTLYDAAKVDGAGAMQRFRLVTIPQLRYPLIIILILQTTAAVKLFDIIAVLTEGGPGDRTMVTYYYIYRIAFGYMKTGLAAAGAYFVSAIILVLAVAYYALFKGNEE
jgi:multiple sugar transport system permease protein